MEKEQLTIIKGSKACYEVDLVQKIITGELSGEEFVNLVKVKGTLQEVIIKHEYVGDSF